MMSTYPPDVVIISASDRTADELAAILLNRGWVVTQIANHFDALSFLTLERPPVLIAMAKWRDVLLLTSEMPHPPNVVVTVPFADEALWAEVLNLGGYDVIVQPFDQTEVRRIIQAASRHTSRTCVSVG